MKRFEKAEIRKVGLYASFIFVQIGKIRKHNLANPQESQRWAAFSFMIPSEKEKVVEAFRRLQPFSLFWDDCVKTI